ncbi:MAG TPA: replicative DNA helicase [Candidatus Eisenbacteria bacterium]|jgi:replicative DNA helicase|nr:replicative DNA helicase [Candidatus Eisenbacteria bacterium]
MQETTGFPADLKALNRQKLIPQNIEAEIAVLGSMMIDPDAIAIAIENLNDQCFYKDQHRKIFQAIVKLFVENKAVDLITLSETLYKEGAMEAVGGPSYLGDLTNAVPTSANVLYYARIVKEKYILRHLIQNATQIVTDSFDTTQDVEPLLDRAEQLIFDITQKKFSGGVVLMKELVRKQIDTIDRIHQRKGAVTGIATGFHQFDMLTAGLQPSDLVVVAARPSMGKSAFMSNIAEHCAMVLKLPTAIFSLEMSKEQLVQRMLCSCAKVNAQSVRTGFTSESDWRKLTSAAARLSEAPILIDDTPGISVLELKAKARRLLAQFDIKILMVDYLQLMQGRSGSESRQQEISEISRSLKELARELNVPIIALSQLSRAVESREGKKPQLSDLRESGAIEQDADLVVLLVREEMYKPEVEELRGKAEINIAKQRNGPVGTFNLTFLREFTRFENAELTRREEMA